jgi:acyl dehydratase
MAAADPRWGVIDADAIAEARQLIGVPLRRDRMRWNDTATRDGIRQFAAGVGDDNPLWLDPSYASETRWGEIIAPPSFLYAIDATIVAPKLPGVQWIYAGTRWRWYDVIRVDDEVQVEARLTEIEEKAGKRFGPWVLQKGEIVFSRNDGGLICLAEGRVARTPRQRRKDASEKSVTQKGEKAAEARKIDAPDVRHEQRRGRTPRNWEDVTVGERLGPKAITLDLDQIYRWYMGAQGALHYGGAHGDGVRYRRRHDDYEINRQTGAKDSAARGHFSSKEGKDVGMGGAYDVGLQRIGWVIAFLTDWMGNDAHLAETDVDVLAPNLIGDTTSFSGAITAKWIDENAFVALSIEGRNQKGVLTTRGSAIVALPSGQGPVALPLFGGDRLRWTSAPNVAH